MTGPEKTAVVLLAWLALWLAACLVLLACSPVDGECGGETSCRDASQVEPGGPPSVRLDLPGGLADHDGTSPRAVPLNGSGVQATRPSENSEAPTTALPGAVGASSTQGA